jgi:hypothetical protein
MKNFLYLRVNAIIGILISLAILALVLIYMLRPGEKLPYSMAAMLAVFLMAFGVPVFHNLLIIHIYRRYYPAKEIPKPVRILNIVCSILCIIEFMWWLVNFYYWGSTIDFQIERTLIIFVFVMIFLTTLLIQVTGSFRLIKKVRAAAHQQLESSFV